MSPNLPAQRDVKIYLWAAIASLGTGVFVVGDILYLNARHPGTGGVKIMFGILAFNIFAAIYNYCTWRKRKTVLS